MREVGSALYPCMSLSTAFIFVLMMFVLPNYDACHAEGLASPEVITYKSSIQDSLRLAQLCVKAETLLHAADEAYVRHTRDVVCYIVSARFSQLIIHVFCVSSVYPSSLSLSVSRNLEI